MKIDDKYKWLARDKNGKLWAYNDKPFKSGDMWGAMVVNCIEVTETYYAYSFIKWEDEQPTSIEYAKEVIETVDISHFGRTLKEPIKTRQVLVKFFDNEEYRTELTEESARELIEFLEANKK